MKKTLLLFLLTIWCVNTFAAGVLTDWRWRNNNGTEKTATWKAGTDTAIIISNSDAIRVRIAFHNIQGQTFGVMMNGYLNLGLQYSTNSGQSWVAIKNDSAGTTNAFVFGGNNTNIQNGQATTQQIKTQNSAPGFVAGRVVTQEDTSHVYLPDNYDTELEWVIKPGKNIQPGTTYTFNSNNTSPGGGAGIVAPYAILTTSNDINHPGDIVTSYSLTQGAGNQVLLRFNTALKGHDHFDLQYSNDGITWKTDQTLPGDDVQNHQTTFTKPGPGTYYGRIELYDLNDVMSLSPVIKKTIDVNGNVSDIATPVTQAVTTTSTALNVYPNPANANVSFDLKGYTGTTFTATMTSLYGKPMGKQTFVVNANGHYTLQSTASSGTYILNINGDNLAKSSRVLVQ